MEDCSYEYDGCEYSTPTLKSKYIHATPVTNPGFNNIDLDEMKNTMSSSLAHGKPMTESSSTTLPSIPLTSIDLRYGVLLGYNVIGSCCGNEIGINSRFGIILDMTVFFLPQQI